MSSPSLWSSLLAITLMMLIGYGSRILGLLIMARVPLSPRVRLFVDAMSSSVLIAIITPIIVDGDGGTRFAAVVACAVAIYWRSPLTSIAIGIACAAGWRWWVGA